MERRESVLVILDSDKWEEPPTQYLVKWWGDGSGNTYLRILPSLKSVSKLLESQSVACQNVEVYPLGNPIPLTRTTENVPQPDKIIHKLSLAK